MEKLWEQEEQVLSSTQSVCPECLKRISAQRVAKGDSVFLRKRCPEHGEYQVRIWQGEPSYRNWSKAQIQVSPEVCAKEKRKGCPFDCGLCTDHRQQTCCVLLEVTSKCNLHCPVCFAAASTDGGEDPSIAVIEGWYQMLMASGGPYNIQLSGGEPTIRDDLPEIIRIGKKLGFDFFQVNTNGLRLATDEHYVSKLKAAGLNCVFLQFDGVEDNAYITLRGRPLFDIKQQVIDVCARYDIGVVLVPTLAPGVNYDQIGKILQFAIAKLPIVRGVHFQPISYFGRYTKEPQDNDRITIPELLRGIEQQTSGQMKAQHFRAPGGEHVYCSFHGNFVVLPSGEVQPLQQQTEQACCCPPNATGGAKQARQFVARQWSSAPKIVMQNNETKKLNTKTCNFSSLDEFLERVSTHTLAVSGMAFQDAWTLDLERLKQCFIHVVSPDKRLIPFCAYNLTDRQGRALYRGHDER